MGKLDLWVRFGSTKFKYIAYDAQSFTLEALKISVHVHFNHGRTDILEQPSTMEVFLPWDETTTKIETNMEFQSMLEEFMRRAEKMCFITLHPIPWAVIPPDDHFIPLRDNTVAGGILGQQFLIVLTRYWVQISRGIATMSPFPIVIMVLIITLVGVPLCLRL